MKTIEAAALLVTGTVLLTFSSLSFLMFPRPLTFSNPELLVEATFVAGALLAGMAARKLRHMHQMMPGQSG